MRALIFLLLASISFAADTIKIEVVGTPIDGSPLSLDLHAGADILDAMAVVGGMTASSSSSVVVGRGKERYVVDTLGLLCSLDKSFQLQDGDRIAIPEHIIGTGYWERFNSLLLERVARRHHGIPMTDAWRKKAATLIQRNGKKKEG